MRMPLLIALSGVLLISSLAAQAPQPEVASTQLANPVLRAKTMAELTASANDAKRVMPKQKQEAFEQASDAITAVATVRMFNGKSVDEIIEQAKALQSENPVFRGKTVPEILASIEDAARAMPQQKREAAAQATGAVMEAEMIKMFNGKTVDEIIEQAKALQNDPAVQTAVRDRTSDELSSTISTLQSVRAQLELYKLQHGDRYPDFAAQGWNQVVNKTDESGEVAASGKFGPYLQYEPVNAIRKASGLVRGAIDTVVKDAKAGWLQTPDGKIHALDAEGRTLKQP